MSVTLVSSPTRTIKGILSNVTAGRSQAPFEFLATDFDHENYKINVDILDENDVKFFDVTFKFSPKPDGTLFIDLGQLVTEVNENRGALSTRFKIQYFFTYVGAPVDPPTIAGEWLATYGERQILSEGGANLWEYLLKDINTKLTTVFENPRFWSGFQRTASAIMDSNFNARTGLTQFRVKNTFYDRNKNELSTLFGEYSTDLTPRLGFAPIINGGSFVGVSVEGLTEEILYQQTDVCKNPLMVDWLNSLGGIDQWLFNIDQIYERDAKQGLTFETAITENIENVNKTKGRQADRWTQQVILKAENLTLDQFKALAEIKSSFSVRVWLNANGSNWVGVVASSKFTSQHNSQDQLHEFTLQLEFPDNFDVTNALNYAGIDELIDSDQQDLIDSDLEILEG